MKRKKVVHKYRGRDPMIGVFRKSVCGLVVYDPIIPWIGVTCRVCLRARGKKR